MSSNNEQWAWPRELDALTAAPQHHQLLFENEYVRVLDTNIPPGDTTNLHTRRYPASLYVVSWSDLSLMMQKGMCWLIHDHWSKHPHPVLHYGAGRWRRMR